MNIFDLLFVNTYWFEFEIIFKLIIAFIVGGAVGYTRTVNGKPGGMRTQMLLCVGSALLTAISVHLKDMYYAPNADPARLMAQIVTGIGFVGGGVILKSDRKVLGVTTAAMIWVTAAIGIAIGSGLYLVSLVMMGFIFLLEPIAKWQFKVGLKAKPYMIRVKTKHVVSVIKLMQQFGIREQGREAENGDTTIYILSSFQRNTRIEEEFNKKKVAFALRKINTQDFE
jgi:putative Mg2+ transporter-C (MgtC) family protein